MGGRKGLTRFFARDEEPDPAETDEDVRCALARLDRYPADPPLDRRRPADGREQPLGNVISLWPR